MHTWASWPALLRPGHARALASLAAHQTRSLPASRDPCPWMPGALRCPSISRSLWSRLGPPPQSAFMQHQMRSTTSRSPATELSAWHARSAANSTPWDGNLEQARRNQAFVTASFQRVHLRSFLHSSTVMLCTRQPVLNSHRVQPHVMGFVSPSFYNAPRLS